MSSRLTSSRSRSHRVVDASSRSASSPVPSTSTPSRRKRRHQEDERREVCSSRRRSKSKPLVVTVDFGESPGPSGRSNVNRRRVSSASSAASPDKRSKGAAAKKSMRRRLRESVLEESPDLLRQRLRETEDRLRRVQEKLLVKKTACNRLKFAEGELRSQLEDAQDELDRAKRDASRVRADKSRVVSQHTAEMASMQKQLIVYRKRADKAEYKRAKKESLAPASTSNNEGLLQDVFGNLKELLDSQLQCSICNEIYALATTISCGHNFCEDCIEVWRQKKRGDANCPICRADIVMVAPNQTVDSYVDKFVDNFFPDDAKRNREELLNERKRKREERMAKAAEEAATVRAEDNHVAALTAGWFRMNRYPFNLDSGSDDGTWSPAAGSDVSRSTHSTRSVGTPSIVLSSPERLDSFDSSERSFSPSVIRQSDFETESDVDDEPDNSDTDQDESRVHATSSPADSEEDTESPAFSDDD